MKSILVTGSQGLIGKTLKKHLNKKYILKGFDKNLPVDHADYGDINNYEQINHRLRDCDGVIHLAAVSRVIWGEKEPEYCWQTNVNATENLLKQISTMPNPPWFLYASSREVYGQQIQLPITEAATLKPLNIYAKSKVAAEELTRKHQQCGFIAGILRFSSVYGRIDDHSDRVMPAFCRAAAFGKQIRIDGFENILDFTHVLDVVVAIEQAIAQLEKNISLSAIHLTSGQPTTLYELATMACSISKQNSAIFEAPSRNFDVSRFYAIADLACELLGWTPKINLIAGISQMINDFTRNDSENSKNNSWLSSAL